LLTADIRGLAPGQAVTITVKATVGEDVVPTSVITNRAYLIHGANVTVQTAPITVETKASTNHNRTLRNGQEDWVIDFLINSW